MRSGFCGDPGSRSGLTLGEGLGVSRGDRGGRPGGWRRAVRGGALERHRRRRCRRCDDRGPRRKESDRPTNEWVITSAEHLRIVSDDLWTKAHEALHGRQKASGFKRASSTPVGALDSKYLLTGMVE